MATVQRINVAPLLDHVVVTLQKEDYYPSFEKALKTFSKQANIPGFRKGMVPTGVIKKMYGTSIYSDEVLKTVEREVNAYMEKERPDIFGQPLPTEDNNATVLSLNMNQPGEHSFTFEIGLRPAVVPAALTEATLERPVIQVEESVVDEEIERLRSRYGNMKEPETVEQDDTLLNIAFAEIGADGNLVEGGKTHQSENIPVKYFAEAVRPQWMGLKVGDALTFTLAEAFEDKELDWVLDELKLAAEAAQLRFVMTISKIGWVEKRALDEEFFNQLFPGKAIATEAEFRQAVTEDIQSYWVSQVRGKLQDDIYHYLLDNTSLEFPEDFLKRWMVQGSEKKKTPEEAEKEFPSFRNQLKWSMISDYLIDQNNLHVEMEELREYAKRQMMSYMGVTTLDESNAWLDSYVDRMMQDKKYIDENYHRLLTEKLFTWAESQVQYKDVPMTAEAFQESVKAHHHHH